MIASATSTMSAKTSMPVATAVTQPTGSTVSVQGTMVFTNQQSEEGVPANQFRVGDKTYSVERHPGAPLSLDSALPSIQLNAPKGTLDALIAAERAKPNWMGRPNDADYNAAQVVIEGVLNLGSGTHDHSIDVTHITAA